MWKNLKIMKPRRALKHSLFRLSAAKCLFFGCSFGDCLYFLIARVHSNVFSHHQQTCGFFHMKGFVMNLQPSEAEAGFDMRVPPTADPVALQERIDKEWAPKSRNMTYTVSIRLLCASNIL
jgi:hypothetical protein